MFAVVFFLDDHQHPTITTNTTILLKKILFRDKLILLSSSLVLWTLLSKLNNLNYCKQQKKGTSHMGEKINMEQSAMVTCEMLRRTESQGGKHEGTKSEHKIKSKDQIFLDVDIKLSNCLCFVFCFSTCRGRIHCSWCIDQC